MKMNKISLAAFAATSVVLMGCMDADGTYNKTASGAGVGAAVGGVLGNVVSGSGDKAKGAAKGAIIGGIIGGIIGNDLEKQENELRGSLNGTGAQIVNQGDRLVVSLPEAITFPVNGTDVKSSLYAPLASISSSMNSYRNTTIQVVGHADNSGSTSYNQQLSERRARSVAQILINNGVNSSRITTVGMGENSPIASNSTASGKQANRRVEIYIYPTN